MILNSGLELALAEGPFLSATAESVNDGSVSPIRVW